MHDHLHNTLVPTNEGYIDRRYINVCPDVNNNSPVLISDLVSEMYQIPNKIITLCNVE